MLLAELTPEQQEDWDNNEGFNVRGSNGELYRILGYEYNNILGRSTKEHRDPSRFYLLGYFPIDPAGMYLTGMSGRLMQKVLLECDAPRVAYGACCTDPREFIISTFRAIGDYGGKI